MTIAFIILICLLAVASILYTIHEPELVVVENKHGDKFLYLVYFVKKEDEWICTQKMICKFKKNGEKRK